MASAVDSSFEVAFWFMDQALNHNEYLQPQKLHRLLFLAQSYYAVAYAGKKLMPSVFVADELGPIEPNLFKAFSKGRPEMDLDPLPGQQVEMFLDSIWRRFGHHSVEHLTKMCKENTAYQNAYREGVRSEIKVSDMKEAFRKPDNAPDISQVVRPKVMRSASGRPVAVKSWIPGLHSKKEEEGG